MGNFFSKLLGRQKLVSPIPGDTRGSSLVSPVADTEYYPKRDTQGVTITTQTVPMGSETPTMPSDQPRNPKWNQWQRAQPKRFQELLAGAQAASKQTGVPAGLLMDISGLETSGGQFLDQLSGGPGQGYFQFEPGQSYIPEGFDPYSATQSALLAGKRIAGGNLSNWGTPGGNWGTLDNPNNVNGKLTDFYTNEELNPYLSPQYQF